MTYHCEDAERGAGWGLSLCGELEPGDVVVPLDEVHDPSGRHINCPGCGEKLANLAGGSMRRPGPPAGWVPKEFG